MKTRTQLLYQCQFCSEELTKKKALIEHTNNVHSPRWKEDKTIHLSGGDQVILIAKSQFHSWDFYHKSHSKTTHISFIDGGKRLEQWEKDNGIEFVICCDKVESYRIIEKNCPSISKKYGKCIRNLGHKGLCKPTQQSQENETQSFSSGIGEKS